MTAGPSRWWRGPLTRPGRRSRPPERRTRRLSEGLSRTGRLGPATGQAGRSILRDRLKPRHQWMAWQRERGLKPTVVLEAIALYEAASARFGPREAQGSGPGR